MHNWDFYMCCCAQGVRGLFNAWTNAVSESDKGIEVNILINYADKATTVRSYLPAEGRVEVSSKKLGRVAIRVPSWVSRSSLRATVGGASVTPRVVDGFLVIQTVIPETTVSMTFEIPERTHTERILDVDYMATWRGDTVIRMDPQGSLIPLYERSIELSSTSRKVSKKIMEISFSL